MKIFLIVIAMMSSNAHTDLFVISTPTFKDPRTCIEFVNVNTNSLKCLLYIKRKTKSNS